MKKSILVGAGFLVVAILATTRAAGEDLKHLQDAQVLLENVKPADNSYEHGEGTVTWKGSDRAKRYVSHTDCSGLFNHLLGHSYGYSKADLAKWFGKKRPTADHYHDTIKDGRGFTPIAHIKNIRPGDILGVKYFVKVTDRGKVMNGHVMLVAAAPQKVKPPVEEVVAGTEQWQVTVIDSSRSPHGPTDTRYHKDPGKKNHEGLGRGVLRLYADKHGKVAGYAWSTKSGSKFIKPRERHLVIGRLKPGFKP